MQFQKTTIKISTNAAGREIDDGRYLLLETDMKPRQPRYEAIRLSAVPYDEKFLDPEPTLELDESKNSDAK